MNAAEISRFAPSTTGPAHAGTLLAALLCWLDARSRGAQLLLRLEDLDPQRSTPERGAALQADLAWLGLDWDACATQSALRPQHEAALDRLAEAGVLYPCRCSRTDVREHGLRARDGGFRYPNTCRGRELAAGGWRATREPLRVALSPGRIALRDESGMDLSGDPAREAGDPIVRRRDGALAYQLATVVDDGAAGVSRIVRGRDLAGTSATQVALQRLLGLPTPRYRHHFLLLERDEGGKLSKLHAAPGGQALRATATPDAFCARLARAAGLTTALATRPRALLEGFDWQRVRREDRVWEATPA